MHKGREFLPGSGGHQSQSTGYHYNLGTMPLIIAQIEVTTALALLIGGIVMLVLGGNWLVEGSVIIARRLGVSPLIIGLTIVAFGTSAPELALNITAALLDHGELSFGNVVGSNIANIGLVLGFGAMMAPLLVSSQIINRELPWLIGVTVFMTVIPFVSGFFFESPEGYGIVPGVVLILIFFAFTLMWYRQGQRDRRDPLLREASAELGEERKRGIPMALMFFLLGLGLLVCGGWGAEKGAVSIAEWLGWSDALIGLTIVAIATSLPEAATTFAACRKGHTDLAVGNIVGSNLFNILLVLGATTIVAPVPLPTPWGVWDLLIMLGFTVILLPITRSDRKISRREGLLLLLCYVGYLAFTVLRETAFP